MKVSCLYKFLQWNISISEHSILPNLPFSFRWRTEGDRMDSEIRELNRIICKDCDEKEYEKCKDCKVYRLVNKIVEKAV